MSAPTPIARSGCDTTVEEQRGALAFANGYVYVAFGGFAGGCGNYHGWVVGIKADGSSTALNVFQDQAQAVCPAGATSRAAGIWGTSGPAGDTTGKLYLPTGKPARITRSDCGATAVTLHSAPDCVGARAPTTRP